MTKKKLPTVGRMIFYLSMTMVWFWLTAPAMALSEDQTRAKFDSEINAAVDQAVYFVAYDKSTGQPFAMIASPGTEVLMDGTKKSLAEDLITVLNKLQERAGKHQKVEVTCDQSYYIHGSPGCRIKKLANGGYKVVCR